METSEPEIVKSTEHSEQCNCDEGSNHYSMPVLEVIDLNEIPDWD